MIRRHPIHQFLQRRRFRPAMLLLALIAAIPALAQRTQNDSPCNQGRAVYPNPEPRSSEAICMPEIGRMNDLISPCRHGDEDFGLHITPVGDVDNDSLADWCIEHDLCDTNGPNGRGPIEALLYHGVRGGLPDAASGVRIGPTEIASITSVLAAGDWDGDGFRDILTSIQLLGDTTSGSAGRDVASLVVFWGNASHLYSIFDTSHLSCGADFWAVRNGAVSSDLDSDHIDDLIVWNVPGQGLTHGTVVITPKVFIFRGLRGLRWGDGRHSSKADWQWWNVPSFTYGTAAIDQDCDGANDIILYDGGRTQPAIVTVLYGKSGGYLPDTAGFETIDLTNANGHYALLTDLTGDGVPEIAATCGNQEVVKVWAGRHGMRLKEQFGSGLDQPPSPGWVARPWASIWLPARIDPGWPDSGLYPVFDLGDATADGIPDLWVYNPPWMLCYASGLWMDSLVDAIVDIRPGPIYTGIAILGDIDGSGRTSMAIGNYTGVIYIRQSPDVPHDADQARLLPPGTDTPCDPTSAGVPIITASPELTLEALPNPSEGEILFRWSEIDRGHPPELTITDESGHEVKHLVLAPGTWEYRWPATGVPSGAYFVRLRRGTATATASIRIR